MSMLSHLKKETMHHAFVIEGDTAQTRLAVFDFLKKEFEMDIGHNDLILLDRGDFGIENVQEIVDVNSRKPTVGMYKIIVVVLHSISHQAQNAILKTLEEPRPGTFIFILTNTSAIFLPTILSRVQVVRSFNSETSPSISSPEIHSQKNKKLDAETLDAQFFLKNTSTKRLAQIKEILALKSDDEIGDAEIFNFVQEVEKLAYDLSRDTKSSPSIPSNPSITPGSSSPSSTSIARIFTKVEEYMRDASSSKKLLLEYMALSLPKI